MVEFFCWVSSPIMRMFLKPNWNKDCTLNRILSAWRFSAESVSHEKGFLCLAFLLHFGLLDDSLINCCYLYAFWICTENFLDPHLLPPKLDIEKQSHSRKELSKNSYRGEWPHLKPGHWKDGVWLGTSLPESSLLMFSGGRCMGCA